MSIGILVVDDEPLARRKLADFIMRVPWATLLSEASDGEVAVEAALRLHPEIIFLDIQMPELSGIQVVEHLAQLEPAPAVVFTTAYDKYAITAFELEAVDYLLKPFGRRRFLTALERARDVVQMRGGMAALDRARSVLARDHAAPADRIFVRERNSVLPLSLTDIEHIEAQDDYVLVYTQGRHYLVSLRMAELEEWLPNPPFLRVHRSHIVNLDYVDRLVGLDDARFDVQMKNGNVVRASRARSQEIRRMSQ